MANTLYFGDCLDVMREHIPDESIDLIYLDPPFKSDRDYNLLFPTSGNRDLAPMKRASVLAFEDTWYWDDAASARVARITRARAHPAYQAICGLRDILGETGSLAYASYMAERLAECHRVLKSTGSIYLHCDPTMSHYLKVLMDVIFGARQFQNDIVWKRRYGSLSRIHSAIKFGVCNDNLLLYTKSRSATFNTQYSFEDPAYRDYLDRTFRHKTADGRLNRIDNLANPAPRPNLMYDYKGYPHPKNGWAISRQKMELWDKEGRLEFPKKSTGRIQRRRFLDEVKGRVVQSIWSDIKAISSRSNERLGYLLCTPIRRGSLGRVI